MTRVRVGIGVVGLGWMGQAHSRSYRRIPALFPDRVAEPELVLCADPAAGRRDAAVADFGFAAATDDWRRVVEHSGVDVVVITAPNMLHVEIASAAAAAGKAVFCEKPVGGTPAQVAAAERAARHVTTGVGYNYRWAPLVQYAKALIDAGSIGTITNYRGRFLSCYGNDPLGALSWRYLVDEGGYGVSSDLLSHSVDLAHFLVGEIVEVVGVAGTFITERPLPAPGGTHYDRGVAGGPTGAVTNEDYAGAIVRFANGALGTFESSRTMVGPESQNAFDVHGTRGSLSWNLERLNELQVYLADGRAASGYTTVFGGERFGDHGAFVPGRANPIGFEDLVTIEDHHFLTAVAERRPFDPGFAAALAYAKVQAALLASWETKCWTPVTEIAFPGHAMNGPRSDWPTPSLALGRSHAHDGSPSDGSMTATIRLTTADAIVRFLVAQRTVIDGVDAPLVPGVFAIFGHGNVTCLGPALHAAGDALPTWRGQNEQGMALAAIAYAKAMRRRQFMVATTSIGPGALNMVTAAGVAMANRLPVLLLAGDTFQSRLPDPVLQQVEHFGAPSTTVNDAFRAVVRYWDRVTRPEQLLGSLPQAIATLLDPAECGPAFIALPQDVQAEAFDFPLAFFDPVLHQIVRPRPDTGRLAAALDVLRTAERPLLVAGGGVHYSLAEAEVAAFAERHGIPIVETVAGKSTVAADHPCYAGPIGVIGAEGANRLAAEADVVLAVGTRLADFATGSWSVFQNDALRIVGINTARFDAVKHRAVAVVGDARETIVELGEALGGWRAPEAWTARIGAEVATLWSYLDDIGAPGDGPATYAQVVAAVNAAASGHDYALTASGGFPGELNAGWRSRGVATFDCEYGFSCMGYEISGGWGAAMARARSAPDGDTFVFAGDGSYLMMNSDLYSSVLSGHKMIVIVCDNGGFAVIDRLQVNQGGASFNNLFADVRIGGEWTPVDFAANAASLGCDSQRVHTLAELADAIEWARGTTRTTVIVIDVDPHAWTEGGAWWEVGVPEVSEEPSIRAARAALDDAKARQRKGV